MPRLHLPAHHSDEDLAVAGALAEVLRSDELYVAWSFEDGQAAPVVPALLREPEPPRRRRPGLLGRLLHRRGG
jgi:hypothetical protein